MKLVLVRHGDPDYERDCLTELGHKQAEIVAKRLLSEGIEKIFSSPLGRAKETAQHFSDASGIKDIEILDFMREIRFGPEDDLYNNDYNPWLAAIDMIHKGEDLQAPDWREYPAFINNTAVTDVDNILTNADKWLETLGYKREGLYYRFTGAEGEDKTIVLFSHGGSSTAFLSRVLNIPFLQMCVLLGHLRHTAITVLRFDSKPGRLTTPIVDVASDAGHLLPIDTIGK